jgi:hypothetical protein
MLEQLLPTVELETRQEVTETQVDGENRVADSDAIRRADCDAAGRIGMLPPNEDILSVNKNTRNLNSTLRWSSQIFSLSSMPTIPQNQGNHPIRYPSNHRLRL